MFQAVTDKAKNQVKVSYAGRVTSAEIQRGVQEVEGLLVGVRPGFRLLNDMSALESMELTCLPFLERLMDVCNEKGIGLVARVIPDPHKDIGLNILSLFHYRREVRIVTCATVEEAEKVLES